jgi:hypothetical protein
MTFTERLNKLEQMDQLIRLQATGCSKEFAKRIDVSESSLFRLLNDLKELGAEIRFSPIKDSYCFCCAEEFKIGYKKL